MGKIKNLLGIEPNVESETEQLYSPSAAAHRVAIKSKTDYNYSKYPNAIPQGSRKVLIIGTNASRLEMQNGKFFVTGNHPVEMFVPMLHWQSAGYEFDFASIDALPIALEEWAMPENDEAVMSIYKQYKSEIQHPLSLSDAYEKLKANFYDAIFIPGGHGAVLGLPFNIEMKKILQHANANNLFIISICHGPAAFLSAAIDESPESYIFKDYKIAAFPDSNDKLLPSMGYLPGKMPWYFGEKLNELDVTIVNKLANGTVHKDRNLITGDSPMAANKLGQLSAETLLNRNSSK